MILVPGLKIPLLARSRSGGRFYSESAFAPDGYRSEERPFTASPFRFGGIRGGVQNKAHASGRRRWHLGRRIPKPLRLGVDSELTGVHSRSEGRSFGPSAISRCSSTFGARTSNAQRQLHNACGAHYSEYDSSIVIERSQSNSSGISLYFQAFANSGNFGGNSNLQQFKI